MMAVQSVVIKVRCSGLTRLVHINTILLHSGTDNRVMDEKGSVGWLTTPQARLAEKGLHQRQSKANPLPTYSAHAIRRRSRILVVVVESSRF
jgi:hypothetical protein